VERVARLLEPLSPLALHSRQLFERHSFALLLRCLPLGKQRVFEEELECHGDIRLKILHLPCLLL
jgi:hypothetical protein